MLDSNVHRMLVGGPRDNQIVFVNDKMPPYQVHMFDNITALYGEPTTPHKIEVEVGNYFRDEFYWGSGHHEFYRWQGWSRKVAAKIYMRRMGADLWEIFNNVEWETWGK